jgi:hypothetical protein
VAWINTLTSPDSSGTRQNGGVLYRLPTDDELAALANVSGPAARILRSTAKRVWKVTAGASKPSVWTAPGQPRANIVPADDLLNDIAGDLHNSGVLHHLMKITAVDMAVRLAPTGAPIQAAAQQITAGMMSSRSGRNAVFLENSPALEELQAHLREARTAAAVLHKALSRVQSLDAETVVRIREVLARYPISRVVRSLEKAASLGRDVAIAQEWNRDLGVERALPQARMIRTDIHDSGVILRKLTDARPAAESLSRLERCLGLDADGLTFVRESGAANFSRAAIGSSLRMAVTTVLKPRLPDEAQSEVARFGGAVLRFSADVTPQQIDVDLGTLAEAIDGLSERATRAFSSPAWAATVVRRLRDAAAPVLGRHQPLTSDTALAIRVPALVLAAEAVLAGNGELAAQLRRLAAATCLMRRRAEQTELLETIILAAA